LWLGFGGSCGCVVGLGVGCSIGGGIGGCVIDSSLCLIFRAFCAFPIVGSRAVVGVCCGVFCPAVVFSKCCALFVGQAIVDFLCHFWTPVVENQSSSSIKAIKAMI